jgi:hypothetical protein
MNVSPLVIGLIDEISFHYEVLSSLMILSLIEEPLVGELFLPI